MSTLIAVSSLNRNKLLPGTSNSDFTVNMGQVIQISSMIIKSITFTNVIYNVTSKNNVFTYEDGGLVSLPAVEQGYYNIDELIAVLEPLLNVSVGGANTIVKNAITGKLTFNYGAAITTLDAEDGNSMAGLLGLLTSAIVPSATHVADGVTDMAGVTQVYVISRGLTDGSNIILKTGLRLPVLTEVPVTAPYGGQNYYKAENSALNLIKYNTEKNIQQIDIVLVDQFGDIIDLHGTEFTLIAKVYSTRDPTI